MKESQSICKARTRKTLLSQSQICRINVVGDAHDAVAIVDADQKLVLVRDTAAGVLEHDLVIPGGVCASVLHCLCPLPLVAQLELDVWILQQQHTVSTMATRSAQGLGWISKYTCFPTSSLFGRFEAVMFEITKLVMFAH